MKMILINAAIIRIFRAKIWLLFIVLVTSARNFLTNVCIFQSKGSDTLESFLSKVAFESNLQKKLARIEHVLLVKAYFERRKIRKVFMTHVQDFF